MLSTSPIARKPSDALSVLRRRLSKRWLKCKPRRRSLEGCKCTDSRMVCLRVCHGKHTAKSCCFFLKIYFLVVGFSQNQPKSLFWPPWIPGRLLLRICGLFQWLQRWLHAWRDFMALLISMPWICLERQRESRLLENNNLDEKSSFLWHVLVYV